MKKTEIDDNDEELTPQEAQALKTREQRSEDIAYTINHALACTATDFIDPFVGDFTQKWIGKRFSVGCGSDHCAPSTGDHSHGHDHGNSHSHSAKADGHLGHWWLGEVIGDFGSVPITVGIQHYFPGFMDGLKKGLEPVLGKFFKSGAERTTRKWAAANGIEQGSEEYREYKEAVYNKEIDHLPQALVWTASSIALNLGTQKLVGNDAPMWQLAAAKATGATISAALVVGGRGLAPGAADKWDSFTSEKIFLPATKAIGKVLGIDGETVDRMAASQKVPTPAANASLKATIADVLDGEPEERVKSWQQRVTEPQPHEMNTTPTR